MGDAGPAAASGSGAGDFEFGVDPSLDPELAMVRFYSVYFAQVSM
jgi:26S proteasome regulatory subunit N10